MTIFEYLENIATAIYGKEVRTSIVNAISQCYSDGKAGAIDMTARNAIAKLEGSKASVEDMQVLEARMDAFVTLPEGSTILDGAIEDACVDNEGNTHDSLGNAIRTQIKGIKKGIAAANEYTGFLESVDLAVRSKWTGNVQVNTLGKKLYNASPYYLVAEPIEFTEKNVIVVHSATNATVYIRDTRTFVKSYAVTAGVDRTLDVSAGDTVFIQLSSTNSKVEENIVSAVANAGVTVTFAKLQEKIDRAIEERFTAYSEKRVNLFDANRAWGQFLQFNPASNIYRYYGSSPLWASEMIPVEAGENYVTCSEINFSLAKVFYDENYNVLPIAAPAIESVPCTWNVAGTFCIPADEYKECVTATKFYDGINYYTLDTETGEYTQVDTSTAEYDSGTTYYTDAVVAYMRLTTVSNYHNKDTVFLGRGTVAPNNYIPYDYKEYTPSDGFQDMITDIVDDYTENEFSKLSMICYGDSQTYGTNAAYSYVKRVAERLGLASYKNYATPGMRISNSYDSGTDDAHCIAYRLRDTPINVSTYKDYSIVTLAGGINDVTDITQGYLELGDFDGAIADYKEGIMHADDFTHGMVMCCHYMLQLYTGQRLLVITPPRTVYSDAFTDVENMMIQVADYFGIEKYVSSKVEGINTYVPNYSEYTSDKLHPNEKWNEVRARKIAAKIKSL